IAVVCCGDACILWCLTRLQFRGKLIYQRLDRLKSRVGVGILRIEIRDDARVLAVAQPVVIIDADTAECLERLRYDRRNRDGAYRACNRVGRTKSQPACERNCSGSREAKREKPSSRKPAHENQTPGGRNRGRMRRLAGAVWAQEWCELAWFDLAHSSGVDRTIVYWESLPGWPF